MSLSSPAKHRPLYHLPLPACTISKHLFFLGFGFSAPKPLSTSASVVLTGTWNAAKGTRALAGSCHGGVDVRNTWILVCAAGKK
ncbi:hypothetical protein CH063_15568 [Colletotrichum higginsianum]|uniref:Uncharacterized protein n=1 Tax=Colletotrichum higginsianum (strain IMI 349063) TaxID=759273 RepID=H1W3E9_COLHI|nr:hypothetical protein CH063_15568 [Colletotrichum higginsianum]